MVRFTFSALIILFANSCTPAGRKERFDLQPPVRKLENSYQITGKACYYSDQFQGRKTASGERYDRNRLTAAHKTLPLGTIVEVCNLSNQKRVRVTINDRGPFRGDRIIDLSRAAYRDLGGGDSGFLDVEITVLP